MLLSSFSRLAFRAPLSRPFSSQSSAHANQSSSSNSSKRWIGIASVLVAGCVGFAMSERHSFFAKEQESPQDPLLSPNAFKSFTLEEVVPVNHNTKIFRFALPLDRSLDLPLTSCVVVGFTDSEGKVVVRCRLFSQLYLNFLLIPKPKKKKKRPDLILRSRRRKRRATLI